VHCHLSDLRFGTGRCPRMRELSALPATPADSVVACASGALRLRTGSTALCLQRDPVAALRRFGDRAIVRRALSPLNEVAHDRALPT
jgi:hypothetical protein